MKRAIEIHYLRPSRRYIKLKVFTNELKVKQLFNLLTVSFFYSDLSLRKATQCLFNSGSKAVEVVNEEGTSIHKQIMKCC